MTNQALHDHLITNHNVFGAPTQAPAVDDGILSRVPDAIKKAINEQSNNARALADLIWWLAAGDDYNNDSESIATYNDHDGDATLSFEGYTIDTDGDIVPKSAEWVVEAHYTLTLPLTYIVRATTEDEARDIVTDALDGSGVSGFSSSDFTGYDGNILDLDLGWEDNDYSIDDISVR